MSHDKYGKEVLQVATGGAVELTGPSLRIDYGAGRARIDATVGHRIAVEVESREPKQMRGALMDILWHPFPKKLMVLIPAHLGDPEVAARQCGRILGKQTGARNYRVVVLQGTGRSPRTISDVRRVRKALRELGWSGGRDRIAARTALGREFPTRTLSVCAAGS